MGDEAEDGDIFSQHFAVIELQGRNVALGVDVEERPSILQLCVLRSTFTKSSFMPASWSAM